MQKSTPTGNSNVTFYIVTHLTTLYFLIFDIITQDVLFLKCPSNELSNQVSNHMSNFPSAKFSMSCLKRKTISLKYLIFSIGVAQLIPPKCLSCGHKFDSLIVYIVSIISFVLAKQNHRDGSENVILNPSRSLDHDQFRLLRGPLAMDASIRW